MGTLKPYNGGPLSHTGTTRRPVRARTEKKKKKQAGEMLTETTPSRDTTRHERHGSRRASDAAFLRAAGDLFKLGFGFFSPFLRKLKRCIKSALLAAQRRVLASHRQRTERSHTDRWGSRKWERRGAAAPAKQSGNSFKSVDECAAQPIAEQHNMRLAFIMNASKTICALL